MSSLFEKLKETHDFLADAKIKSQAEKEQAELEKLKKEKQELEKFVNSLRTEFIEKIENGKIPSIKIKNHDRIRWIKDAAVNRAKFCSVWDEMIKFFKNERLRVTIKDEHDGVGVDSWIVLEVELITSGYRGIEPSSATHGLKFDLDVGEYRG